jgi:AcrR family transcriptional regulator
MKLHVLCGFVRHPDVYSVYMKVPQDVDNVNMNLHPYHMAMKDSYHHPDLRQELLDQALLLLKEDGIKGFSLRKLASRAGASHAAPYRHFGSKDEILAAILLEGHKRLKEVLEAARSNQPGGASEKLLALGRAYVDFARGNPEHLKVMFTRDGLSSAMKLSGAVQGMDMSEYDSFGVLVAAVRDCQAQGSIPPDRSAEIMSLSIWAEIHGLSVLLGEGIIGAMTEPRGISEEEAYRSLMDIIGSHCGIGADRS